MSFGKLHWKILTALSLGALAGCAAQPTTGPGSLSGSEEDLTAKSVIDPGITWEMGGAGDGTSFTVTMTEHGDPIWEASLAPIDTTGDFEPDSLLIGTPGGYFTLPLTALAALHDNVGEDGEPSDEVIAALATMTDDEFDLMVWVSAELYDAAWALAQGHEAMVIGNPDALQHVAFNDDKSSKAACEDADRATGYSCWAAAGFGILAVVVTFVPPVAAPANAVTGGNAFAISWTAAGTSAALCTVSLFGNGSAKDSMVCNDDVEDHRQEMLDRRTPANAVRDRASTTDPLREQPSPTAATTEPVQRPAMSREQRMIQRGWCQDEHGRWNSPARCR